MQNATHLHLNASRSTPNFSRPLDSPPVTTSLSAPYLREQVKKKSAFGGIKAFFNRKFKAASMPPSIGLWHCCQCGKGHKLYQQQEQGPHLVTALSCDCPHRSCENCTLSGGIKPYKPVQEPIPVQLSDTTKRILFGIFCGDCGSSWQARPIGDIVGSQSMRQKVSAVPKNLIQHGGHPLEKLRASRSMANLFGEPTPRIPSLKAYKSTYNLRVLSNEMEKEHGKQANSVMVMFSGIDCTCGRTLDSCDLCFQIIEQPEKIADIDLEVTTDKQTSHYARPEDIAKGHDMPVLTLTVQGKVIHHQNPLRSCPVTDEELTYLYGYGK